MMQKETLDFKTLKIADNYNPSTAMLEVTSQCNATCEYCYMQNETFAPDLDTGKMLRVIDKLDEAGIMFLSITGGEPFYRKDILEILAHITTKGFFKTSILSNGTLISDEHIDFLIQNKRYFSFIRFSIFSHLDNIHDAYVGVLGALKKLLVTANKLRNGGINVSFALNVLDFNAKTWNVTRQFFTEKNFDVMVGFLKLRPNNGLKNILEESSTASFYVNAFALMDEDEKKRLAVIIKDQLHPEPRHSLCIGIKTGISVDCNGQISPCTSLRNIRIGNIFDNKTIQSMLKDSFEFNAIRAMGKNDLDGCVDCPQINDCNICLGMVYNEYKTFREKPVQFCNLMEARCDLGRNYE